MKPLKMIIFLFLLTFHLVACVKREDFLKKLPGSTTGFVRIKISMIMKTDVFESLVASLEAMYGVNLSQSLFLPLKENLGLELGDISDCVLFICSSGGGGNSFGILLLSGKLSEEKIKKLFIPENLFSAIPYNSHSFYYYEDRSVSISAAYSPGMLLFATDGAIIRSYLDIGDGYEESAYAKTGMRDCYASLPAGDVESVFMNLNYKDHGFNMGFSLDFDKEIQIRIEYFFLDEADALMFYNDYINRPDYVNIKELFELMDICGGNLKNNRENLDFDGIIKSEEYKSVLETVKRIMEL